METSFDNEESLIEQIMRTGLYVELDDKEAAEYRQIYLACKVEEALYSVVKERMAEKGSEPPEWKDFIRGMRKDEALMDTAKWVMISTILFLPDGKFDFSDSSDIKLSLENHNGEDIIQITPLFLTQKNCLLQNCLCCVPKWPFFCGLKSRGENTTHGKCS